MGAARPTSRRGGFGGSIVVFLIASMLIAVPTSTASAAEKVPGIDVSQVARRCRLGRGRVDAGPVRHHAGDDRQHGHRGSLRRSEVRGVPRRGDRERARRGRVPPGERRARPRTTRRTRPTTSSTTRRSRPATCFPVLDIEQTHGLSVAADAGLGARVGPTGPRPDRREADDLHEPELLGDEHGRHAVVRGSRLSAVDRPLGGVRTERARGELGRARLDVLAVDLDRPRRGDRRERRPGPFQRHESRARQDRVARGDPAARWIRLRRPDRLRRRRRTTCTRLANPDTVVTLAATPDPGATLLRWTGACSAAGCRADVRCADAREEDGLGRVRLSGRGRASGERRGHRHLVARGARRAARRARHSFAAGSTVTLTAEPDSASTFAGWSGAMLRLQPGLLVPGVLARRRRGDVHVRGERRGGRRRRRASRGGDRRTRDAIGGSYRWERRAGASTTFAFSGGAVTLFTVSGPAMGKARIRIDGVAVGTFDGYAPTLHGGREASLRGARPRAARPHGGGARHEASCRGRDARGGGRAAVGRTDAARSSRVARQVGHEGSCIGERRGVRDQRRSRRSREALVHRDRRVAPHPPGTCDGAGRRSGWTARS